MNIQTAFFITLFSIAGIAFTASSFSDVRADTLWMPVIYYDFHADQSNPNFQQHPPSLGLFTGMIEDTLSSEYRPIFKEDLVKNDRLNEWYRPSGAGTEAKFDIVKNRWSGLINVTGKPDEWIGKDWDSNYDMANIVIFDSLPLTPADSTFPQGTYQYLDTMFFPINNRGIGNEIHTQNYSFTVEMHTVFTYTGKEFFEFKGDDDVWVFINGKLAIDIGGIHMPTSKSLQLVDIENSHGLEHGKVYRLDFYSAERYTGGSNLLFTTNIVNPTIFKSVAYYDTTTRADGLIDLVKVSVDNIVTLTADILDSLFLGIQLPAYRNFQYDRSCFTITSAGFEIAVKQPPGTIPFTGVNTNDIIVLDRDIMINDQVALVKHQRQIEDMMGPVVNRALFFFSQPGYDTLEIHFSEKITTPGVTEPFNFCYRGDNQHFYSMVLDTVPISVNADGDQIRFRVVSKTKTTPENGDSAWIVQDNVYDGTLILQERNTKPVPLEVAICPVSVVSATYLETDLRPDGYIDCVRVRLDQDAVLDQASLTALAAVVQLPSHRCFSFSESDLRLIDHGFEIAVQQDTAQVEAITSVSGDDVFSILQKTQVSGNYILNTCTVHILDSLGPVVLKGLFYPKSDANNVTMKDTLIVDFTEEVTSPVVQEPFDFFDISGLITGSYSMELTPLSGASGNRIPFLVDTKEKEFPQSGDSLWIRGGNNVEDVVPVVQRRDTKPAPLEVTVRPVSVVSATYLETDLRPDGYIDCVRVRLDQDAVPDQATLAALASVVQLPSHRCFSFSESDLRLIDHGFEIAVQQDRSQVEAVTSVSGDDVFSILQKTQVSGNYMLNACTVHILDSLGPVVLKGLFCPKSDLNSVTMKDTLIVDFSEEVKAPVVQEPFSFLDISGLIPGNYSMELTPLSGASGNRIPFLVDTKEKEFPQSGDSLWIRGGNNVEDVVPVVQLRDTKPAPLIVRPYPLVIRIKVTNPVTLSDLSIHRNLIEKYQLGKNNEGMLFVAEISGRVPQPEKLTGDIKILDAVGNIVMQYNRPAYVEFTGADNKPCSALTFVWNICNRNNRRVGPATYYGVITVKSADGISEQKSIMLGVKE